MKRITEKTVYMGERRPKEVKYILSGPEGAVQFVYNETKNGLEPFDLGYHSKVPQYDGQESYEHCPYCNGPCYYEGSTLNAVSLMEHIGSEFMWKLLLNYYEKVFFEGRTE